MSLLNSLQKISRYSPLAELEVIGRSKYLHSKAVPELTYKMDERIEIPVDSCTINLDRMLCICRDSSAAWPRERGSKQTAS